MSKITKMLKQIFRLVPGLRGIVEERDWLRERCRHLEQYKTWRPPGHFYSPIPDLEQLKRNEDKIFDQCPREIGAVDLNLSGQIEFLHEISRFYCEIPFAESKQEGLRYHYKNSMYTYADAIYLYCIIRHLKPRQIIEVGSGYSSAVMLDTNELSFNSEIKCTFIEPNPERLFSLLKKEDRTRSEIISQNLQEVDKERFLSLEKNDILFIDSSHVVKTDSDVNHLFFEILPMLAKGVYVHIHDIFYPFEYPRQWVYEGWSWNEAYLVRAFLEYNQTFRVCCFGSYLNRFSRDLLEQVMPLCLKTEGQSLWLEKVGSVRQA